MRDTSNRHEPVASERRHEIRVIVPVSHYANSVALPTDSSGSGGSEKTLVRTLLDAGGGARSTGSEDPCDE